MLIDLPGGKLTDDADHRFSSNALENEQLVVDNGLILKTLVVTSTVAEWIQIHDVTAIPADGEVPLVSIFVEKKGMIAVTVPIFLVNGLYICNSNTQGVKTIQAANLMIYGTFKS